MNASAITTTLLEDSPTDVNAAAADTGPDAGTLAGWAVELMDRIGGVGAGIAVAAENLFPPIPSEVILPLAGLAAAQGRMSLVAAIVWTTVGSVVGALLLYLVGAWLGRERVIRIVARLPLVDVSDVAKAESWFARFGGIAVLLGRMVPVVRSLVSIPAGVERMPLWRFLLYTLCGSAVWNTLFVLAGFHLGENWHLIEGYAGVAEKVVIAAAVVLIAVWIVRKWTTSRRGSAGRSLVGEVPSRSPSDD